MADDPQVDLVIACHNPKRPIGRAVASVLSGTGVTVGVTVVAHNISVEKIQNVIPKKYWNQIQFLELKDGVGSPAGPFQFGLERARSPWVGIMGSDDYLQEGAVEAWLSHSGGADAVIPRLVHDSGKPVHTPPVRLRQRGIADTVKDRLFYRSAPLGLMRKQFLVENGIHFSQGVPVGSDLEFSVSLYGKGRVRVQRFGPAYVIGSSAQDRVTMSLSSLERELQHVAALWGGVATDLTVDERLALGTKSLRVHIFGAAYYRAKAGRWLMGDREQISFATKIILAGAPGCELPLSLADRELLDALVDTSVPDAEVNGLAFARRKFGVPSTLFTRRLTKMLDREAPIRFMAASYFVR